MTRRTTTLHAGGGCPTCGFSFEYVHAAVSYCNTCGTLRLHFADGRTRDQVPSFVHEERHRLAERNRRASGAPVIHRAEIPTLAVARVERLDPREHVAIADEDDDLDEGVSDLVVWHDAIERGDDPQEALARHWSGREESDDGH